jgi:hypothetical protein
MLSSCPSGSDREVVLATKHYSFEILQLSEENFNIKTLLGCAETFRRKYRAATFARLLIGTGPEIQDYLGKGTPHQSIEGYFLRLPAEFPSGLRTWARLAMVLKIGPTVILRVRRDGKVREVTVSGEKKSPPRIKRGNEILDIGPIFDSPAHVSGIEAFVRNREDLSEASTEQLADEFCALQPALEYRIFARRDSWFVEHDQFPFLYAFDPGFELPTFAEYRRGKEVWAIRARCRD